jgi:hypothetical protein
VFTCDNSQVTSPKDALQDQALDQLKLIFQIVLDVESESSKDKKLIFEYALRFSLAKLASTIRELSEYMSDPTLIEKSAFLTPIPTPIDFSNLQPQLVALQKYLLATLL